MSDLFPFIDLSTAFWPLSRGTVCENIAFAIITSVMLPFALNAAVVTAPISQLFFRGVVSHRETRLRLALRANALGSVASLAAAFFSLVLLTTGLGDGAIPALFLLIFVCPFLVPGLCEGFLWSFWTQRPVVMRAMAAHVTGRCSFAAMILGVRWIRERMTGTCMERYCQAAIPHLHVVGFFCLGVLILAWLRSPKILNSPNSVAKETVT